MRLCVKGCVEIQTFLLLPRCSCARPVEYENTGVAFLDQINIPLGPHCFEKWPVPGRFQAQVVISWCFACLQHLTSCFYIWVTEIVISSANQNKMDGNYICPPQVPLSKAEIKMWERYLYKSWKLIPTVPPGVQVSWTYIGEYLWYFSQLEI